MAAIDKTYVTNFEDFIRIQNWMKNFVRELPNGTVLYGEDFLYYPDYSEEQIKNLFIETSHEIAVMNTSLSMDYFLIKECPIDIVQNRMKEVYSKEEYEAIKNGTSKYDTFKRNSGHHIKLLKRSVDSIWAKDKYTVNIELPYKEGCPMYNYEYDIWDLPYELSHGGRCSWAVLTDTKSFKALIRKIINWKLPIGTKVIIRNFYWGYFYAEFLVTK